MSLNLSVFINIVLLTVLIISALYIIFPWCVRNILKRKFLSTVKGSFCTCLTFDDGPNCEFTPRLLELLKDEGVKATFFVTGHNVDKYPYICEEIIKHGHEIGEHGYYHIHPWLSSPIGSLSDLIRGSSIIKKRFGTAKNILLRPPYGKLNLGTLCYVIFFKRKLAFWNVDPKDYCELAPDIIAENVKNQLTDGSVILLHERSYDSEKDMENRIHAIKLIINNIKKSGYICATLSEAMELCSKQ